MLTTCISGFRHDAGCDVSLPINAIRFKHQTAPAQRIQPAYTAHARFQQIHVRPRSLLVIIIAASADSEISVLTPHPRCFPPETTHRNLPALKLSTRPTYCLAASFDAWLLLCSSSPGERRHRSSPRSTAVAPQQLPLPLSPVRTTPKMRMRMKTTTLTARVTRTLTCTAAVAASVVAVTASSSSARRVPRSVIVFFLDLVTHQPLVLRLPRTCLLCGTICRTHLGFWPHVTRHCMSLAYGQPEYPATTLQSPVTVHRSTAIQTA